MAENMYPVLCGSSFFTLVLQAAKSQTSSKLVFTALMKIIDYSFNSVSVGRTFDIIVAQFRNCSHKLPKTSACLPYTDSVTRELFLERIYNGYPKLLKTMQDFTSKFINIDKSDWLVRALLELIESDKSIEDNSEFYVQQDGQPIPKAQLVTGINDDSFSLQIHLPAFLLGVWHFIIASFSTSMDRTNSKMGKVTFNNWHKEPEIKGGVRTFIAVDMGSKVKCQIEFIDVNESSNNRSGTAIYTNLK